LDIKNTFTPLEAATAIPDHSRYSNHIPNTGHTYGAVTNTMDIIKTGRKGRHLYIFEK
jgi:hypothetical protein